MSTSAGPSDTGRHGTIALLHLRHEGALPPGVDGTACQQTRVRGPFTLLGGEVTP
ncbi:hypothetical protein Q8791_21130 [Nocardiopsis sp. CT-R113]|uniref:Uncharacterized protein n=1 Tax=Nocardiopsis codii TaxID=3065942 RepID=A0ABU7KCI3_9ACTN|nr:hypothetical protein [Nocardiopsis sp. CT-R113]MEE2039727.1 hypothetical protein [Nocardiopsis sp. CT-R113]